MKSKLCILLLLAFSSACQQKEKSATITLHVKNSIPQMLTVIVYKGGKGVPMDSVQLSDKGQETVSFEVPVDHEEQVAHLNFSQSSGPWQYLVLSPGEKLQINTDLSYGKQVSDHTTYSGSKLTSELLEHDRINIHFNEQRLKIKNRHLDALMTGLPDTAQLRRKRDSLNTLIIKHQLRTAQSTNSPFILQYILAGTGVLGFNFTTKQYQAFKEKFKNDEYTLELLNAYEKGAVANNNNSYEVNNVARNSYLADFSLPDSKNKLVKLSQFKGKYVLVDLWSSWCGPCRGETPYLKDAMRRFAKKNFMILSVSIDEKRDSWQKAIKEDGTQGFVHLISKQGWKSPIIKQYGVRAIPSNFLLNPEGKVIDKDLRGEGLIAELNERFKPGK